MLTQAELRAVMHYDPFTGTFTSVRTGARLGTVDRQSHTDYVRLAVHGRKYRAHRLAFLWLYGSIPEVVDHWNGNGLDNRISNLRAATYAENNRNRRKVVAVSGLKGVDTVPHNKKKPYRARCRDANGKERHLGYFATPAAAHQAYCEACVIFHREFANYGERNV